jgi:hypothetical protein
MDLIVIMNEFETTEKLLHKCADEEWSMALFDRHIPFQQAADIPFHSLDILFQVDVT